MAREILRISEGILARPLDLRGTEALKLARMVINTEAGGRIMEVVRKRRVVSWGLDRGMSGERYMMIARVSPKAKQEAEATLGVKDEHDLAGKIMRGEFDLKALSARLEKFINKSGERTSGGNS
jgi:hypothetical protein